MNPWLAVQRTLLGQQREASNTTVVLVLSTAPGILRGPSPQTLQREGRSRSNAKPGQGDAREDAGIARPNARLAKIDQRGDAEDEVKQFWRAESRYACERPRRSRRRSSCADRLRRRTKAVSGSQPSSVGQMAGHWRIDRLRFDAAGGAADLRCDHGELNTVGSGKCQLA